MTTGAAPSPIEARLAAAGLPALRRWAWLEIDTDALAANLRLARTLAPPGARVAPVVKSGGYGHGLEVCARTLAAAGADLLCVATLDEGLHLRALGLTVPILVIFEIPPSGIAEAAAADLEVVAADPGAFDALLAAAAAAAARPRGAPALPIHLEVETGLIRGGFPPAATGAAARRIRATPGVRLAGLFTHLSTPANVAVTDAQRERLTAAGTALADAGVPLPPRHWAATGGQLAAAAGDSDIVRPGLLVYGLVPDGFPVAVAAQDAAARLRPVMALKARPVRVAQLAAGEPAGYGGTWVAPRASLVATLPLGYGDGWSRAYGGRTQALVRGQRVPLVGSVAMDAVLADVTEVPGVTTADEFVLLGEQGGERITAAELAHVRTTISWEVLAAMSARVARVYHAAAGPTGLRTLAGELRRPGEKGA